MLAHGKRPKPVWAQLTCCARSAHAKHKHLHRYNARALATIDLAIDDKHLRKTLLVGELWLPHGLPLESERHVDESSVHQGRD